MISYEGFGKLLFIIFFIYVPYIVNPRLGVLCLIVFLCINFIYYVDICGSWLNVALIMHPVMNFIPRKNNERGKLSGIGTSGGIVGVIS